MGVGPGSFLFAFPVIVMLLSLGLQGVTLTGGSSSHVICNPNNVPNCGGSSNTVYTCDKGQALFGTPVAPCVIQSTATPKVNLVCPKNPPPPSYCSPINPQLWLLPVGSYVSVPNSLIQASNSAGVFFGLGTVGPSGFIIFIGLLVGIASLAGLTIFGSSFVSVEGAHMLLIGGAMTGLWVVLSGLDGFLGNPSNPASMFTQMNANVISMGGPPIGTAFYVMLTLLWFVNFIFMVKRG